MVLIVSSIIISYVLSQATQHAYLEIKPTGEYAQYYKVDTIVAACFFAYRIGSKADLCRDQHTRAAHVS
jgi:hypothetical protein